MLLIIPLVAVLRTDAKEKGRTREVNSETVTVIQMRVEGGLVQGHCDGESAKKGFDSLCFE